MNIKRYEKKSCNVHLRLKLVVCHSRLGSLGLSHKSPISVHIWRPLGKLLSATKDKKRKWRYTHVVPLLFESSTSDAYYHYNQCRVHKICSKQNKKLHFDSIIIHAGNSTAFPKPCSSVSTSDKRYITAQLFFN